MIITDKRKPPPGSLLAGKRKILPLSVKKREYLFPLREAGSERRGGARRRAETQAVFVAFAHRLSRQKAGKHGIARADRIDALARKSGLKEFFAALRKKERALRAHPKGGGYLFGGAEPLTSSQFNKLWLDLLEPAGLTTTTDGGAWKGNRKSQRRALVTPHQLRHEYAYTLYRAGVPALAAKALMGHSDIRVTQNIYTELGQRDLTDAAALLNAYVGQSRESPETNMDKSHTDNQKT